MKFPARLTVLMSSVLLSGCLRDPSVLFASAGPHAKETATLFWFFLAITGVIFVLVLGVLFVSLWRRREEGLVEPFHPLPQTEKNLKTIVGSAVGITIVILTALLGLSYAVDQKLIGFDRDPQMEIEITGHQWWWEIRYLSDTPSDIFTTANEQHIPVGTKVHLVLKSADVIHSVWIPNLSGKRDIIPGHDEDMVIRADRKGVFHGRCAEFCGVQHAFMELTVYADSKSSFDAWAKAQRLPAPEPLTAEETRGRDVFTKDACALCHVIRGTDATGYSSNAPDLTHLKSRKTIAAGAAPNTKTYLGKWIIDPYSLKPGAHMPPIPLAAEDYRALRAYLETLK